MIMISTKEWKFIVLLSLFIVTITFLPTLLGIIVTPQDSIFLGTQSINADDTPVYYSWIEQVKDGHLFFKNLFTSEDQVRYIFDPFWLSVGLFAKTFSLSAFTAYQLARTFLIPIFLALAYIFISYFFEEEKRRKICFIFLIFASGLGWFISLGSTLGIYNFWLPPMDVWVAEATTFYTLHHTPHFIVSLTLILLIFLLILVAFEKQKIFYGFLAGLTALVFFLFHPYYVPTIFLVIGTYIIVQSVRSLKIRWDLIKHYLILIFVSSPAILYHFWTLNTFWSRQQFALQNNIPMPPFYNLLFTYGFLLLLSLCGIAYIFQKKLKSDQNIFILTWWGVQWFLPFLPFLNYQRKMLQGFHFVMIILAIHGLFYLKEVFQRKVFFKKFLLRNKFLLILLFILLFVFSDFYILMRDVNFYLSQSHYAFVKKEKIEAMRWIKQNIAEDNIIFSSYTNGNLIPVFALKPVYCGQWGLTASFQTKCFQTNQFFENYSDEAREAFLKINGIDYLFYGSEERQFKNFNPEAVDFLEKIYQNSEVAIYKVKTR